HATLRTICQDLFSCFNATATPERYTLSLHDALPISAVSARRRASSRASSTAQRAKIVRLRLRRLRQPQMNRASAPIHTSEPLKRSEEHTSELQSRENLVCRLLLEKKNKNTSRQRYHV